MKIFCKKCYTKYHVESATIGPRGRSVKCTQCNHIWFQRGDDSINIMREEKPKIENSILPVVVEYFTPPWFKAIPILFACLIAITSVFVFQDFLSENVPYFSRFYNKIGMPNTKNLVLSNVEVKVKESNSLDINGVIINKSQKNKKLPKLLISIMSNDNKIISQLVSMPNSYIKKDEKHAFYKKIDNLPANAKYISVGIADKFDVLFH